MRHSRFFLAALAATCVLATWLALGAVLAAPHAQAADTALTRP